MSMRPTLRCPTHSILVKGWGVKAGKAQDHATCTKGEWGRPLEVVEKGTRGLVPDVPGQIEEIEKSLVHAA